MREFYYSTGEFARLNGVNKRTLHYYDEIGCFRRNIKGKMDTGIIPVCSLNSWS